MLSLDSAEQLGALCSVRINVLAIFCLSDLQQRQTLFKKAFINLHYKKVTKILRKATN